MESFEKEFVMEMFLENESVATINRLMVTATDIVKENAENLTLYNDKFKKECMQWAPPNTRAFASLNLIPNDKLRNKDFYKNIVQYSDSEYQETFHMKKSTFEELVKVLKESMTVDGAVVPLEKKLLVFLWLLTSDASFQEVGLLFGLHKSTVSYIFYEIAELIMEQRYRYITWPTIEEQHLTRLKINSRFHFPNCVGTIDACRLRVGSKRNKKGRPDLVLLQAVCDESLMFLDVYVGDLGRTKKTKVLKDSPLLKELSNFIEFDNHILGDSGYKLRVNLITPFTSEELLTDEEMKFNELHWRVRAYIGRAFELLRERFRKLNFIDINKPEAVSTVVTAACVLHNFILIHEGSQDVKEEPIICDEGVVVDTNIVKTAPEKRQFLCNFVNFIDSS